MTPRKATPAAGTTGRATRHTWVLAMAAIVLAGCAAPTRPPPEKPDVAVRIERMDRSFPLDKSITRVEVVNRLGEITVKGHDEPEVGVRAVIQRLPPDFAKAELTSRRDGATLHIETALADAPPGGGHEPPGHVDIAVYLPSSIPISLTTDDARIAAGKRLGAIDATTRSGAILAASRGRLTLRTDTGQIRAMAIGKRWTGESRIETGSGRIILLVPTFGDIALDAETGGQLTTNFGLSVHQRGDRSLAHARYGRGTSPLIVRSRTGKVVLDQLVLMDEDAPLPEDDD
ncbi:MAG TPA: hypothetical protein VFG55_07065 [Rhodanobacteraceae bacterium]|nr:hypothetical protein [Rhodanobacteraceae bacterium]